MGRETDTVPVAVIYRHQSWRMRMTLDTNLGQNPYAYCLVKVNNKLESAWGVVVWPAAVGSQAARHPPLPG
jgi:hypothetical protein